MNSITNYITNSVPLLSLSKGIDHEVDSIVKFESQILTRILSQILSPMLSLSNLAIWQSGHYLGEVGTIQEWILDQRWQSGHYLGQVGTIQVWNLSKIW